MEAPITHNQGPDPALAYAAIHEVEKIEGELESEKGAYMARCRALRDRIKTTIEEYRDKGLSKRDIRDALKIRKHLAKIEDLKADRAEESGDEATQLDLFMDALARGEAEFNELGPIRKAAE